jgi:hypothetical protein
MAKKTTHYITAFVRFSEDWSDVQILAHVPWHVSWQARFNWPNGPTGQPAAWLLENGSQFTVDPWVRGEPKDLDVVDTMKHANRRDKEKVANKLEDKAQDKLDAKWNTLVHDVNRSQDTLAFGNAILIGKKWPAAYNPGPTFCVNR